MASLKEAAPATRELPDKPAQLRSSLDPPRSPAAAVRLNLHVGACDYGIYWLFSVHVSWSF